MQIETFHINAFTEHLFNGNPAAICLLSDWLADDLLQKIAAENNLSETAFLVPRDNDYHIRWFTPKHEIELCGHATLAASYVIFNFIDLKRSTIVFHSASGKLSVEKNADQVIQMDFPTLSFQNEEENPLFQLALHAKPIELYKSQKYVVLLANEHLVRELQPDFSLLKQFDRGVVVTAKGDYSDFVSRFFSPNSGIDEDPVTGSAHCILAPLWAEKLGKTHLHAKQLSTRGGEIYCEVRGERVLLAGKAVLYSRGKISLSV